jgi:hypothetical protein
MPDAGHLPNRGGVRARDRTPSHLPRQRRGITPQGHGRYPDYDVLAETGHWDAPTRRLVLDRAANPPPVRFFSDAEARTLRAFCDVVMAQGSEPRIPVLEMVDAKFHAGKLDGYRHHDMPEDPETWRRVAANLDASARREGCGGGFAGAPIELRQEIVGRFSEGELDWRDLSVKKAWSVVMRAVLAAFYSHPWAWNEIGFGGPAYPRGFARLGAGQREHWESPPALSPDPVKEAREGERG